MAKADREQQVGLKAIRDAREGRGKSAARVTPQHLLFVLMTFATVTIVYFYVAGHKLDAAKDKLLQKQRAVQATVGAEWAPLRDKLEKTTLDAAASFKGDFVDSEAGRFDFRGSPGIYLRLRVADATSPQAIRKASSKSLRDAFVGCLLREPLTPKEQVIADVVKEHPEYADAGSVALESHAAARLSFPDQPWNMREAYASTRILTEEWVSEVRASDDDLRLRVFEQQYEHAAKIEIPHAVEMLKKAQFFLLVLDEDTDAARDASDGGAPTEEALQLVPHETRVHIVNLRTGGELLRVRRSGQATFTMAGGLDPQLRAAMQRNVNNCDLANQVQVALAEKK